MSHLELYRRLCKGDRRHNRRMKGFLQTKAISKVSPRVDQTGYRYSR
jgi:hypothetical protein